MKLDQIADRSTGRDLCQPGHYSTLILPALLALLPLLWITRLALIARLIVRSTLILAFALTGFLIVPINWIWSIWHALTPRREMRPHPNRRDGFSFQAVTAYRLGGAAAIARRGSR